MDLPDNKYDYYTVTVDSLDQASKNTFSVYLTEPMKNVVQAKLLATHIHSADSVQHLYISINELIGSFNLEFSILSAPISEAASNFLLSISTAATFL